MDRRVDAYNFHKWSVEFIFNTLYMYILYTLTHHLHPFLICLEEEHCKKQNAPIWNGNVLLLLL